MARQAKAAKAKKKPQKKSSAASSSSSSASSSSASSAPQRPDAARSRARILKAARKRVSAGEVRPSLNAVAREAGVGVATVYRHFETPEALLEALVVDRFDELDAVVAAGLDDDDAGRGLVRVLSRGLALELEDPGLAAVLFAPAVWQQETLARMQRIDAALGGLIARARHSGDLRDDVSADDLRRLVCGLERAVLAGSGGPDVAQRYLSILLVGLGLSPALARSTGEDGG